LRGLGDYQIVFSVLELFRGCCASWRILLIQIAGRLGWTFRCGTGCFRAGAGGWDVFNALVRGPLFAGKKILQFKFRRCGGQLVGEAGSCGLAALKTTQAALHLIQGEKSVLLNAIFCVAGDWLARTCC
jgi:hypothetical protein